MHQGHDGLVGGDSPRCSKVEGAPPRGGRIHPAFLRLTRRLTADEASSVGATSVAHPPVDHRHVLDRSPRATEVAPTIPPATFRVQSPPWGDPAGETQTRIRIRFASGSGRATEHSHFIRPYRGRRKSTLPGRPGRSRVATAGGVRAMMRPARITSRRVARRRRASMGSPAWSTTRSARQPGAMP